MLVGILSTLELTVCLHDPPSPRGFKMIIMIDHLVKMERNHAGFLGYSPHYLHSSQLQRHIQGFLLFLPSHKKASRKF